MSSETLILGTRKGLFILECGPGSWVLRRESFLGIPVTYAAGDPRTGVLWACVGHGHWGSKLHRSTDAGATWEEVPAPQYPKGAEVKDGEPAALSYLWVIAPGGHLRPSMGDAAPTNMTTNQRMNRIYSMNLRIRCHIGIPVRS